MNIIVNFVAFQAIWLIAVIGAANHYLWPTIIAVIAFCVWQLAPQRRHTNDIRFVLYALGIGLLLDSAWQAFGLIDYQLSTPIIAPIWILLLWVTLALSINHSLAWLKKNIWYRLVFGLVGAPASYYAGSRLGALNYPDGPLLVSTLLGISWAAVMFFFSGYERLFPNKVEAHK